MKLACPQDGEAGSKAAGSRSQGQAALFLSCMPSVKEAETAVSFPPCFLTAGYSLK